MIIVTERRRSVLRNGCLWIAAVATMLLVGVLATFTGYPVVSSARADPGPGELGLAPLNTVPVPEPANFADFVRDRQAAIALGKALFWDMQAGSDGQTACATCHFSAGADLRSRNQLNPRVGNFVVNGPNFQLSAADFPTHRLADPNNRDSAVLFDTDNVSGSQGVLPSTFVAIRPGSAVDDVVFAGPDPIFSVRGVNVRRATGRNTPSNINAVFNHRNFWDGRAQNDFNGVTPFGARDPDARVAQLNAAGGADLVKVSLNNSSLASQAVGPPGNDVEMSAAGRNLKDIGKKLLALQPLGEQRVSANDSVLGPHSSASGVGLRTSYADLIRQAFQPQWWNSSATLTDPATGRSYTMMEFNFSLFWGLAIQTWEATLVSDQTPLDRFLAGDNAAISDQAKSGLSVFGGKGRCDKCHSGPEMTTASVHAVQQLGLTNNSDGINSDTGFANIGVRPTASDPGNGGFDPFGNPLSETRRAGLPDNGVQGSFKVPALRNVALTGPYFHNGGQLTLRQVVDFYSRQGDFANPEQNPNIRNLGLSDGDKDDLVAFLNALTDDRVKFQSAPFDHPQIFVPAGEQVNADGSIKTDANGRAVDCFLEVPATGAGGGAPLPTFESFQFTGPPCGAAPPLVNPPPSSPPSTFTIGETSILPELDAGNGDLLVAQQTSLAQGATLQSLSFYVEAAAGKLRLGVYDATGPGGGPGAKKAETAEITPTAGWNTANVTAPIALPAGTYWLAYFPSDSGLEFRKDMTGAGRWFPQPYGPMPATFPTAPGGDTVHWSFFATLTTQ